MKSGLILDMSAGLYASRLTFTTITCLISFLSS